MANPIRGEVGFDVSVPGESGEVVKTYTLRFSANAICELEESVDKSIVALLTEMASWVDAPEKMRMSVVRLMFWAGLRDRHPDVDLKAAGELILAAGGIVRASELIMTAVERAFPAPKTKGARPPNRTAKPKAGTS